MFLFKNSIRIVSHGYFSGNTRIHGSRVHIVLK